MCIFVNWKKYMFDCLMNDMNKKVYFLAAITASNDRKGSLVMGGVPQLSIDICEQRILPSAHNDYYLASFYNGKGIAILKGCGRHASNASM